jgi:hypothetical protein
MIGQTYMQSAKNLLIDEIQATRQYIEAFKDNAKEYGILSALKKDFNASVAGTKLEFELKFGLSEHPQPEHGVERIVQAQETSQPKQVAQIQFPKEIPYIKHRRSNMAYPGAYSISTKGYKTNMLDDIIFRQ